ncbi:hypothetical protein HpHA286_26320 [Helicobacter pylori]
MQLFEKWQSAIDAYNVFYEETEHLGLEVVTFLKHFSEANDALKNAILKMFNTACDGFSILVKTAENIEDYPLVFRFKNDGLGAINKLLETKKGFVAGAFYKEGLGDIDLVWGMPKTKDSDGYGLAHIIERRISNEMKKGLSETEAKEYALNIVKSIPEVLEKGTKGTDSLGRVFVDYGNKRVGLNNEWKNEKLENHWVISSYELYDTEKQALRSTPQAITKEKTFNSLNSVEPNPTIKN